MSFDGLWRELETLRTQRGVSYRRLAAQINGIDVRRRISASTVHDRMANRRRVDWPEMRLVVTALGLPEDQWRRRWVRAEEQWRSGAGAHRAAGPRAAPAAYAPDAGRRQPSHHDRQY